MDDWQHSGALREHEVEPFVLERDEVDALDLMVDTLGADADVCGSPRDERSHRERRGRLARVSVQRVALYAELEKVGVEQDTRAASPFPVDQPHARAGQVLEMP